MKIKLGELKQIIKEEIANISDEQSESEYAELKDLEKKLRAHQYFSKYYSEISSQELDAMKAKAKSYDDFFYSFRGNPKKAPPPAQWIHEFWNSDVTATEAVDLLKRKQELEGHFELSDRTNRADPYERSSTTMVDKRTGKPIRSTAKTSRWRYD